MKKLLFLVALLPGLANSQLTHYQITKISETKLHDLTPLMKDYGFKLHETDGVTIQYANDNKIIKDVSLLYVAPNNVSSENIALIQFSTFSPDFYKNYILQIKSKGFYFLHTKWKKRSK